MRNATQRRLLHLIQHAFVIALRSVELTAALANNGHIDGYSLGIETFFQLGDAKKQNQSRRGIGFVSERSGKSKSNAAVGGSHGASAICDLVAPIEIRIE